VLIDPTLFENVEDPATPTLFPSYAGVGLCSNRDIGPDVGPDKCYYSDGFNTDELFDRYR
jgi:hypothetical protein